jgi:hypothetical protein
VPQAIRDLDPALYRRHMLHGEQRVWVEKNCYIDIWIEVLHALGQEPLAMLPFTFDVDFEGDQWTFFKPPHADLWTLYGVDVQELTVWRPLIEHAVEHLSAGKLISTEADAYWLPDTAGTDYRSAHTKTTIVLNDIDVTAQRLGYFHNASYYVLGGEDFIRLFRLDLPHDPAFLPLFAEVIRVDRLQRRTDTELASMSRALLARAVDRLPESNPLPRFIARFGADFPAMHAKGLAHYHAWAFANTRQLGAAAELAALYLGWLQPHATDLDLAAATEAAERISLACKSLILKGARAANSGRIQGLPELMQPIADDWELLARSLRQLHNIIGT